MCAHLREKVGLVLLGLSTIVLIVLFGSFATAKRTAVIQTASGPVQGLIRTTVNSVKYAAFKGIPFAKPPLAHLRFKPPLDPDPWTDVYNATKDPPKCIQFVPDKMKIVGAEDCLYLNVATKLLNLAKAPMQLRAVIVWIYGGSFITGSADLKSFPPDYLLEKDIVYVSLNYRGGPLGYMSLNHPNASGNAGLKDLVQGLKWVQKNIANFGGNPKNVTVMGGSSGSAAVGYLVLSNLTTGSEDLFDLSAIDCSVGLFHGSISMSGVPINPWAFHTPARALQQAHRLIDELGINSTDPDTILDALYHVPAWNLANATAYIARNFAPFAPTIENGAVTEALLTECAVTKYVTGQFNHIPQIIGFEDQEIVSFVGFPDVISEIIDQSIRAAQMYHMDVPESITSAKERLQRDGSFYAAPGYSYRELRKFINESSNLLYIAGIDLTQRFLAANNRNNPVYYYRLSFYAEGPHCIGGNNSLPGAGHGDDISFIFYYARMNYSTDPTSPVRRTINRLVTMWTNFAKYGHPTPNWVNSSYPLNITWPDSGPLGINLEIGNDLTIEQRFVTPDMAIVENSSWPYLREASGCDDNSTDFFPSTTENYTVN